MIFIALLVQIIFLMFCFSVLGDPWRIVLRKCVGLFKNLDVLQILVLDVYLGGFLLYTIAIIPLHLFSVTTLYAITLVSTVIFFWLHRKKLSSVIQELHLYPKKLSLRKHWLSELTLVGLMFLFSLATQTASLNGLYFGSVRDTSVHSLFVQVLVENKQIPVTLEPYLNEGIIYPQGFTPMIAYSVLILNYFPPQAVFYLTSLFNALTILGVYFLGKTLALSKKAYVGLSLAFVFSFVASWPKYITWGSNAFVASFPFFFICLSLFPFITEGKLKVETVFAIGFLYGFLAILHLQAYEALFAALFILWIYVAFKRDKDSWHRLLYLIMIFSLSLIVLSPFIYRQLSFYQYLYHNIGVPNDVVVPIPQASLSVVLTGIIWLFENLANNTLLQIISLALFFASIVIVVIFRMRKRFNQTYGLFTLGTAMLLGELLVFLLGAIDPSDLPFYPNPLLLYIPFYFFAAAINFALYWFFSSYLSKRILAKPNEPKIKTKKLLVSAVSFILLVGIYSPFLYQSIILDVQSLHGSYSVFAVTTEDDFQLILWIRENLAKNATILVNNFQSGTFIPSIANRKALYPPFGSSYSLSYQKLETLLEENELNVTTMNLMKQLNITDIYVGSGVSPWDGWKHKWDPDVFLGNPNFKMVKNFGDAYLFEFNYTDPNTVFLDDFEHPDWNENAWQTYFYGNGLSNISVTPNYGYHSSRCLRLTAKAVYTVSEWKFASYISRDIYVQNDSDVTLSFYLNATDGFHGKDTFAVLVSNIYRNQSIVITTPNSVYDSYANVVLLSGFEGLFEFKGPNSLGALWNQTYGSSLPETFFLEFLNLDFDSVENVAYIDNITVTSTPIA